MDSAFPGFQNSFKLVRSDTFFGKSTPFDAGRAQGTLIQMTAQFAESVRFIRPYFDFLPALLASDFFGLGVSDFCASWATFLEHAYSLPTKSRKIY